MMYSLLQSSNMHSQIVKLVEPKCTSDEGYQPCPKPPKLPSPAPLPQQEESSGGSEPD